MGFPTAYSELIVPKLLLQTLSFLGFIRKLITILFTFMGLQDFIESDDPDAPHTRAAAVASSPRPLSVSALLILEILPVVKFSVLVDPPDSCAVCLYEFEEQDEIRQLTNCRHIFHRCCLDRWMAYDQKTCPLCRTQLIPDDMQESFNERFRAAYGIPEFDYDGEFSQVTDL